MVANLKRRKNKFASKIVKKISKNKIGKAYKKRSARKRQIGKGRKPIKRK